MTGPSADETLVRENAYLRQQNAQLQRDLTAALADADRLRQIAERIYGRTAPRPPSPLGGGQ
ncbi:hypothetical protein [Phenylobacterium sp.]|uniref:hypothetical protein n=1 Tax=Phenylobacterium sp. TaxID=1871053 RepID=UPI00121981DF|nr:hypothetical protein [Phenylobacterium sp.]TAL34635.1 MAG: hypothetical protein EPN98_08250 [Phenylobacterium sp.]